jgi:hypothetical protein
VKDGNRRRKDTRNYKENPAASHASCSLLSCVIVTIVVNG